MRTGPLIANAKIVVRRAGVDILSDVRANIGSSRQSLTPDGLAIFTLVEVPPDLGIKKGDFMRILSMKNRALFHAGPYEIDAADTRAGMIPCDVLTVLSSI